MRTASWTAVIATAAWLGVVPAAMCEAPQETAGPRQTFDDAPDPWRAYFIQARDAERIDDLLQRCLAYPDLPGNRWPLGHAEAHCRYHAIQPIPLAEFDAYLQRGDTAGLDRRLDSLLEKHFTGGGDGEDIHVAVGAFGDADAESDRVSARWLELQPRSAWANLARANYFRDAAWNARGNKWASETPRANLARMTGLADLAIPLFREAIRIEPRLMPAYVGLLDVAMLDSRPDVEREALAGATAQDPACLDIARVRMNAMEPRWGGSYEDMLAYAAELSKHVARRPQLAIHVAAPYADRGDRLVGEKARREEAAEVLEIAVRTGSNEGAMRDAANVALNPDGGNGDWWKGVALLLQEHRFNDTSAWGHRQIAWHLVRREPEWGLRHARKAVELEPDDAFGQYLLGAAYRFTGDYERAETHYLQASNEAGQRVGSLVELAAMWLSQPGVEPAQAAAKADPYIDRLQEIEPEAGIAWQLRLEQEFMASGSNELATIRSFLRHADRNDPVQRQAAMHIEAELTKQGVPPEGWRP